MVDFIQALSQHITGTVTKEAKRRVDICAECPLKELRDYARIFNSKMEDVNGYVCTLCDCPLATKIFAKKPDNICPEWTR